MRVMDMAKHNASAATSGMFLIYCDCTTKTSAEKLNIVAAVTVGGIGDLIVGKNAVYYDNAGTEWDAVITKVVDNPISVAQAFWSPYRRIKVVRLALFVHAPQAAAHWAQGGAQGGICCFDRGAILLG